MAYVAISDQLKDNVRRLIRTKCRSELATLSAPDATMVVPPTDPFFETAAWGEHIRLKDELPREWLTERSEADVTTTYYDTREDETTYHGDVKLSVLFRPAILVPPKTGGNYSWQIKVDPDSPLIADLVAHDKVVRGVVRRWDKVEKDVLTFLGNCKSLNEGLKLWPDLRVYVPQAALDKVEEKSVRAKAAESKALEVLKSIDTDQAIASAVMVRMLEASKQEAT